jgi:hypothetical protein
MSEPLTKVDSAVQGIHDIPQPKDAKTRRASSSASGVMNINDLGKLPRLLVLYGPEIRFGDSKHPAVEPAVLTNLPCIEAQGIELQIAKETQATGW